MATSIEVMITGQDPADYNVQEVFFTYTDNFADVYTLSDKRKAVEAFKDAIRPDTLESRTPPL